MVPTRRLIVFSGMITIPSSLMAALVPGTGPAAWGLAALLAALALADALISRRRARDVAVTVDPVLRLSQNRVGDLTFHIHTANGPGGALRLGPALVPDLVPDTADKSLVLDRHHTDHRLTFQLTARRRGRYRLERCYLDRPSLLGLWAVRAVHIIDVDIRVYPDLSTERKALARLFLSRDPGSRPRRLLGKGREFEKLREYTAGDSYEDIHWKATARRGAPISKIFQVERTQDIYLMIDASRMSARSALIFDQGDTVDHRRTDPASGETILDRYITAALSLALAAEKQGDRFGVGLFADTMLGFLRSGSGKAHYNAVRDLLYMAEPHRITPDFSELFTFAGTRLRKRSLLIILTSLDDPVLAETFLKHVHILSRRHLVVVNMLKPSWAKPLFSRDALSLGDLYGHLAGHTLWHQLRELDKALGRCHTGFFQLDRTGLGTGLIGQYLDIKQRQIL